jgi:HD superfamily phosphohydrolase
MLLTASGVLHDVGNGPFPHISDQLMKEMLGFPHEEAVSFAFQNSPTRDSAVLTKYDLDVNEISSILEGTHHLSPFFSGFPDLDNADNVYRFLMTIPGKPLGNASYRPSELAAAMSLESREQRIPVDLLERWRSDRAKVYSHLWDDRLNMIGWTMLGRALRILQEDLTPHFFRMSNREAFRLIRLYLPELAEGLQTRKFRILIDRNFVRFRGEAQKLSDPPNLRRLEADLCEAMGLEEWCFGVTVDKPSTTETKGTTGEKSDPWRIYLVSHQDHDEPKTFLENVLLTSEPYREGS